MLFKDFCETTDTYHFKIRVIESNARVLEINADHIGNKYDDYEVKLIDCDLEFGKQSPITHSVDVRPILVVTIKEIKQ